MIEIPIRNQKREVVAHAVVDECDARLLNHPWHLDGNRRYAARSSGSPGKHVLMHRDILGLSPGDKKIADHINQNGLDNRRANLRVVTAGENRRNAHDMRPPNPLRTEPVRDDDAPCVVSMKEWWAGMGPAIDADLERARGIMGNGKQHHVRVRSDEGPAGIRAAI